MSEERATNFDRDYENSKKLDLNDLKKKISELCGGKEITGDFIENTYVQRKLKIDIPITYNSVTKMWEIKTRKPKYYNLRTYTIEMYHELFSNQDMKVLIGKPLGWLLNENIDVVLYATITKDFKNIIEALAFNTRPFRKKEVLDEINNFIEANKSTLYDTYFQVTHNRRVPMDYIYEMSKKCGTYYGYIDFRKNSSVNRTIINIEDLQNEI